MNFHVAQAVCSASRAALLTGCYPNRIGIHGALGPTATHGINAAETTLAEVFKSKGYATGMAGKWHLGHRAEFLPTRHGFDEYFGLPYSNDMWPHHPEAKKGAYPPLPLIDGELVVDPDVTPDKQTQLTRLYTERAVRFIGQRHIAPFFFYLAHAMPHVPLFVSEAFKGKSPTGLYGDVLMEIDWSVGEILKALDRQGLASNTLVIFTSDNGPWLSYGNHAGSAGRLREGKGTAWEGGTRVPCLMRWPGHLPGGTTSQDMMMAIDILPTMAELIGADLPRRQIDGRNLWPVFSGQPAAANPHDAYAYFYAQNELQAVVSGDGRWKLILPHTYRFLPKGGGANGVPSNYAQRKIERAELYDLEQDLAESRNVAAQNPERVRQLTAWAETMRADLGDSLTQRVGAKVRPAGQVGP